MKMLYVIVLLACYAVSNIRAEGISELYIPTTLGTGGPVEESTEVSTEGTTNISTTTNDYEESSSSSETSKTISTTTEDIDNTSVTTEPIEETSTEPFLAVETPSSTTTTEIVEIGTANAQESNIDIVKAENASTEMVQTTTGNIIPTVLTVSTTTEKVEQTPIPTPTNIPTITTTPRKVGQIPRGSSGGRMPPNVPVIITTPKAVVDRSRVGSAVVCQTVLRQDKPYFNFIFRVFVVKRTCYYCCRCKDIQLCAPISLFFCGHKN